MVSAARIWCGKKCKANTSHTKKVWKRNQWNSSHPCSSPLLELHMQYPFTYKGGSGIGARTSAGFPSPLRILHLDHLITSGEVHFPSRTLRGCLHIKIPYVNPEVSLTPSQGTQKINPWNTKQQKSWLSGIWGCLATSCRGQQLQLTYRVRTMLLRVRMKRDSFKAA